MSKKLFVVVMIMGILLSQMCFPALAAFSPTISVKEASCALGDIVEVDVVIEDNSGISGASLAFAYHEDLTLLEIRNGDAFGELAFTTPGKLSNPCKVLWDSLNETANNDGKILTLVFKVSNDAVTGDKLFVNILHSPNDIYDSKLESVNVSCVNGHVSVLGNSDADTSSSNTFRALIIKWFTIIKNFFINLF